MSALCLACILFVGCPSQQKLKSQAGENSTVMEALQALVSWIASRLQSSISTSLALVTPALSVLIATPEARKLFDQAGGIGYLVRHLRVRQTGPKKNSASVQHLYELCFCLWIMTYECNDSEEMRNHFHRDQAVAALVDLVATAPREKVVRVAMSSLRNLATCSSEELPNSSNKAVDGSTFLGEMIGCGLIKSLDLMKDRQWTDPDIVEDLEILHKMLHENYHDMTRWDVYKSEVESGHLQWGIVHTEKFFKQNAKRMEGSDGNFGLVKVLISLAASADTDEEVAAIACYDIGEFVRNYPNGRAIIKRLGAKEIIMKLIEHDNPELQRHALQCVSKMLVNNWQVSWTLELGIRMMVCSEDRCFLCPFLHILHIVTYFDSLNLSYSYLLLGCQVIYLLQEQLCLAIVLLCFFPVDLCWSFNISDMFPCAILNYFI